MSNRNSIFEKITIDRFFILKINRWSNIFTCLLVLIVPFSGNFAEAVAFKLEQRFLYRADRIILLSTLGSRNHSFIIYWILLVLVLQLPIRHVLERVQIMINWCECYHLFPLVIIVIICLLPERLSLRVQICVVFLPEGSMIKCHDFPFKFGSVQHLLFILRAGIEMIRRWERAWESTVLPIALRSLNVL